ncbi:hypothetical protein [Sphingomonas sp. Leaf4]|uniref:hypothetical protein n=1 Tax=Sphingomonas sp. Leaf4 TaxID=2876553 RepID=UPI001E3E848E|nr:hypothetical protein [Sphingomonas sp. Leaf4]
MKHVILTLLVCSQGSVASSQALNEQRPQTAGVCGAAQLSNIRYTNRIKSSYTGTGFLRPVFSAIIDSKMLSLADAVDSRPNENLIITSRGYAVRLLFNGSNQSPTGRQELLCGKFKKANQHHRERLENQLANGLRLVDSSSLGDAGYIALYASQKQRLAEIYHIDKGKYRILATLPRYADIVATSNSLHGGIYTIDVISRGVSSSEIQLSRLIFAPS